MSSKGFRFYASLLLILVLLGLSLPVPASVAQPPDPEAYYAELAQQSLPELVEARDRYSKVFQAAPDLKMLRISATPVHYRDTAGQWLEIDTNIVPSADGVYELEAARNDFQVHFRRDSNKETLVRYRVQDRKVEFGFEAHQAWGDLQAVTAAVDGSQVVYPGIYPGVDLRYAVSAERLLEEFTVTSADLAQELTVVEKALKVSGVDHVLNADGSVAFVRQGGCQECGDVVFRIPPPVMYELDNPGEQSTGLHFEIENHGTHYALKKVIDAAGRAWLADPARVFPVVVDDTVDLDEGAMVLDANIRTNGSTYARLATQQALYLGKSGSWRYRAFSSWSTAAIPDDADIQAVGLHIYVNTNYGSGNKVDVVRMVNDPEIRADSQVYVDIGSEPTAYLDDTTAFQNVSAAHQIYLNLGWKEGNSPSLADLQAKLPTDSRFAIGFRGSNESSAVTSFAASEVAALAARPDLVVFYNGVTSSAGKLARPLRQSFWDGSRYWVFYAHADPVTGSPFEIEYAYSADGVDWTPAGSFADAPNTHHSLWYEGGSTVWFVFHHQPALGNLEFRVGTISGTTITWTAGSWPFVGTTTVGYDFPSTVRDSQGYCWVMARRLTAQNKQGESVVRSTSPACIAWGTSTNLLPVQSVSGNEDIGGYVVPLSNGKVYALYKAVSSLRGRLYNGTSWGSEEVIDSTASFGVYHQGFSAVSVGDTLHLVYVDSNGSLVYRARNGGWGTSQVLATGTFYAPSLSLDTLTNNLYAMYHTTAGPDGDGVMYLQTGTPPYAAGNWTGSVLETGMWVPQTYQGSYNYYALHSNYSGPGRIFCFWVDGIYGLDFTSVLP